MLVTITLLCYNHEKYIKDCLQSICAQSYRNLELIIVDNASSDNSSEIIEAYIPKLSKRFCRVEFIKNANNLGISKGMNQAIKIAKGEYIKSFSADDILAVNAIEKMVEFYSKNLHFSIVVTNGFIVEENFKYRQDLHEEDEILLYKKKPNFEDNYFTRLLEQDTIAAPSVIINSETFQKYGYYDENFVFEDWEFWLRILSKGGKVGYLEEKLVYYRRSPQATTFMQKGEKSTNDKMLMYIKNNLQILDKYGNYAPKEVENAIFIRIIDKYINKCIDLDCRSVVDFIYKEALKRKIKVRAKSKLKYYLYYFKLYKYYKKIVKG